MPPKLLDGTSLAFSLENPKRAGSKADAINFDSLFASEFDLAEFAWTEWQSQPPEVRNL